MSEENTLYALHDAILFTGDAVVENHALLVRNKTIVDIVSQQAIPHEAQKHSYAGQILAPGLIDAQVNGGGGVLFNNTPTADACLHIAAAHRARGTTHILPTFITDSQNATRQAIAGMRDARKTDRSILGIHLEGPHLANTARGVHASNHIRNMDAVDRDMYKPQPDETMLLTLAPENVAAADIQALHQQGCRISLGHTKALADQLHIALKSGATGFTHLFNGMGGMTARDPGVSGIALDDSNSWCGLIADGHHVADEMIRLALRAKPAGKVFLVSDAMPPAASNPPAPFELYGETIRVENGRCINTTGQLAGSAITLFDAVRYCVQHVGVELDEALRMASTYPATFLSYDTKLGHLLPGYDAAIIALSPDLVSASPATPVSG
jgi:N-acetylglucosamine-6-phosphate deacetylase